LTYPIDAKIRQDTYDLEAGFVVPAGGGRQATSEIAEGEMGLAAAWLVVAVVGWATSWLAMLRIRVRDGACSR
jgi:hypothetical protein